MMVVVERNTRNDHSVSMQVQVVVGMQEIMVNKVLIQACKRETIGCRGQRVRDGMK
jgi:hypothetical protein